MSNELATVDNDFMFDPKHLTKETIKKYLCPLASDQELTYGLQVAKTFNLNPIKREIYFVKYGVEPMAILTGYEVYLKRAERSGQWAGMKDWTEGSLKDDNLKACIEVYRKDWVKPLCHEVDYSEYVQRKKDGTINRFWSTKPKTMIKKVAIAQAFRLAFPCEFDGMPYTSDEVIDQERVIDVTESKLKPEVAMPKALEAPKQAQKPETIETAIEPENDAPEVNQDEKKPISESLLNKTEALASKAFKRDKKAFKEWLFYSYEVESLKELSKDQLEDAGAELFKRLHDEEGKQ